MSENVHVISAGSHPVYEVVVADNHLSMTIRLAEDRSEHVKIATSVIPTLIKVLAEEHAAASRSLGIKGY